MSEKLIVELFGQPGAGKSEVGKYLAGLLGFEVILVSDIIRAYAVEHDIALPSRAAYRAVHQELMRRRGINYLEDEILATPSQLVCVDGLRVPVQMESFRKLGAVGISLWCPQGVRLDRIEARQGILDGLTRAQLSADERQEYESPDPTMQASLTVMQMADYHVDANRSFWLVLNDVYGIVAPRVEAIK